MTKFILPAALVIWFVLVLVYKMIFKKFPTASTALLFGVECSAIPFGIMICIGGFIGWPDLKYEEYRWVIGLGGMAVFWIAFDGLRNEFSNIKNRLIGQNNKEKTDNAQ